MICPGLTLAGIVTVSSTISPSSAAVWPGLFGSSSSSSASKLNRWWKMLMPEPVDSLPDLMLSIICAYIFSCIATNSSKLILPVRHARETGHS